MCQVDEDGVDLLAAGDGSEKSLADRVCVKCGEQAVIHLRDEDVKCGKCLVASVNQKFRAVLTKFQLSRSKQTILVAFSGGQVSCALLEAVREATTIPNFSRLYSVLYIEEGICDGLTEEACQKKIRNIVGKCRYIFPEVPVLVSSLEMVFAEDSIPLSYIFPANSTDTAPLTGLTEFGARFKKLLASTKSPTAREELRKLLRNNLFRRIGHQQGLKTLFVGDCADRLAVQLITDTALGRGKHLPLELGYADTRDPDFTIVRPFKDVTMKEILMYNSLRLNENIGSHAEEPSSAKKMNSVYSFTETFINSLQKDFTQTVTTLCRTGDKLCATSTGQPPAKHSIEKSSGKLCSFCCGPMDTSEEDACTAENSIALSLRLSAALPNKTVKASVDLEDFASSKHSECGSANGDCAKANGEGCCTSKERKTPEKLLCYSCRWMLSEVGDQGLLPERLMQVNSQQVRRAEMRTSIQNFLLDDDV
ncbi:hypothetical protein RvY_06904-2 [Ramazzottius varieornatus]|uniref:Cytoplasmic tRNA 2-thiolation protein 2 n=1 Tax=Ramazzottius varieornatus TaxID=947166 RepID=A0A1D1V6G7_RAMVA|nr:hypothetical protein RvY_06904-2 [Ramazzottius varieornatus]